MCESTSGELKFKNSLSDWGLRTVIFAVFLFFGAGKFKSDPHAPWVVLYEEIGFGQWFRYFTAALEILGAFLVLIPQTVTAGLALLWFTLTGAVLIDLMILHRFAETFVPFAFECVLISFWMHRRRV